MLSIGPIKVIGRHHKCRLSRHTCTQPLLHFSHQLHVADYAATVLQAKPNVLSEEAAAARLVTDVDANPQPPASPGLGRTWCAHSHAASGLSARQPASELLEHQQGTQHRHMAQLSAMHFCINLGRSPVCRWRSPPKGSRRSPSASPSNVAPGAGAARPATVGQQSGCVYGLADRLAAAGLKNSTSAAAHPHKPVAAADMLPIQVGDVMWSYSIWRPRLHWQPPTTHVVS